MLSVKGTESSSEGNVDSLSWGEAFEDFGSEDAEIGSVEWVLEEIEACAVVEELAYNAERKTSGYVSRMDKKTATEKPTATAKYERARRQL